MITFVIDAPPYGKGRPRFALEDMCLVPQTRKFRWSMLSEVQDDGKSKLD